jgi:hypothetical protein
VSSIGLRQRRVWRQLVSCIAAYVFALQMVLFAFAAPAIAGLTPDQNALSAALCSHDKSAPLAPAHNSGGDEHCKFCPAGGQQAFTAPAALHHMVVRTAEAAAPTTTAALAPRARTHASAQPRGPPLVA